MVVYSVKGDKDAFQRGEEVDYYFYDHGFYSVKTEKAAQEHSEKLSIAKEEEVPFYTKVKAGLAMAPSFSKEDFEKTRNVMGREACFLLFRLTGVKGQYEVWFQRVKRNCSNFNQVLKECGISSSAGVSETLMDCINLIWCDYETVQKDLRGLYSVYTYYLLRCGGWKVG